MLRTLLCYGYILLLATLPHYTFGQCQTSISQVFPNGHIIPQGDTVMVELDAPAQSGVDYILYKNGNPTSQTLSGSTTNAICYPVAREGNYTVVAQQGGCEIPMEGNSQLAFTNANCNCGNSLSVFPKNSEICSGSSATVIAQGAFVSGTYTLRKENGGSQSAYFDCSNGGQYPSWSVDTPGTYTITGPCAISGEAVITEKTVNCGGGPSCPETNIVWGRDYQPDDICAGTITLEAANNQSGEWSYRAFSDDPTVRNSLVSGSNTTSASQSGFYYFRTSASCPEYSIPLTFKSAMNSVTLEGSTTRCQGETKTTFTARGFNVDAFTWSLSGINPDDYKININNRVYYGWFIMQPNAGSAGCAVHRQYSSFCPWLASRAT